MSTSLTLTNVTRALAETATHVVGLRRVLEQRYARKFFKATGQVRLFRGVYTDFAAASADIPGNRLEGYDNEASAVRLLDDLLALHWSDYPVMFWLQKLLPECRLLLDWGGNVGISYYGYRRYLSYPAGLTWVIAEVPAVAAQGEKMAADREAPGLRFTTSLTQLSQADVLLAAGSLHFMEDPFAPLRAATRLPRHVVINKTPLYERPSAVTLHNMGSAFCAYHLFNRAAFIRQFESLGYRLVDAWTLPDLGCWIPYFPQHSISAYSGLYFTRPS